MANGGERWINMIHLDDLASAIGLALRSGRAGEVYNVADDEPATEMAFYAWLAETLGGELPPRASAEAMAGRKRGLTQKRVSNAKLKTELGWVPGYPTFREGYAAEIARLNGRLQD
jgi:nucleoside-diphosphate-sugar epimerase